MSNTIIYHTKNILNQSNIFMINSLTGRIYSNIITVLGLIYILYSPLSNGFAKGIFYAIFQWQSVVACDN